MRAVRIPYKHAIAILRCRASGARLVQDSEAFDALLRAVQTKPAVRQRRLEKKGRKASKREETARIRAEVFARADGRCEHCSFALDNNGPGEMDHFFGRGKERQTVRNCWALCRLCHRRKTNNWPDAALWLRAFFNHAHRLEFWTEAAKARARLESISLMNEAKEQTR